MPQLNKKMSGCVLIQALHRHKFFHQKKTEAREITFKSNILSGFKLSPILPFISTEGLCLCNLIQNRIILISQEFFEGS